MKFKELRKALGFSQQKFSEELNVAQNTISQWESGRNDPPKEILAAICNKYNVNLNWLLTGEGEMFKNVIPASATLSGSGKLEANATVIPATPDQVSSIVEKAIAKAIKDQKLKIASPTDPGIRRPLIRIAQCGTPAKIAYDTGELTTIASRYEYIDMVVLTEGNSMKEEGIMPGAMVYIKKQNTCHPNQIALICNHDVIEEPRLVLKKVKNNGQNLYFVNGQGEITPLGEKIEIVGVVKHVMLDFE